ncbi:MAG: mandelate racemase/muconate lactonizing enzyme family protein [Elioraea sp.]|nr:mandelate racemase/muconate lactonizing enzyme family protein [Elioraea sp.]
MAKLVRIEIGLIDLPPRTARSDAIQAFTLQETPFVRLRDEEGAEGTGYSYTIGTGGSSVVALLRDHLAPRLIGRDADAIEAIWQDLFRHTHALSVGPLTALALAAIDVALWDLRGRRLGIPLARLAGGAKEEIPVYDTESGWLHLDTEALVEACAAAAARGFRGVKVKVGKPSLRQDLARLEAVRRAIGPEVELMTDANQAFTVAEAIRRAGAFERSGLELAWYEEPLPAEDVDGHVRLAAATTIPIAVGESLYHPAQFRDYLARGACRIVQADVARIGGITPWLKVAHMAEAFNVAVCPHYLMELHLPLCCAVPNSAWLEHIPQLEEVTESRVEIVAGSARAPDRPGHGIEWLDRALSRHQRFSPLVVS